MPETIAGIAVPDTSVVAEATDFVRAVEDDVLFDHSRRVFFWGALHGRRKGLAPDLELLYVGALFHDLGLTGAYRSSRQRFELDGADAAREFLLGHGYSADEAGEAWLAIALHTTPGVPERLGPEVALVTAGVETDVLGLGYHDLAAAQRDAVVAAHPRPGFKRRILEAFAEGNAHRPRTTFGNVNADVLAHIDPGFVRDDFVEAILANPWPE